jgi:glucose-1-phosphate adenylyltransferase
MGIYIFTWSKLKQYLIADEANPDSTNDFGKNIIPAMLSNGEKLSAYRFNGYWKDVGTITSLWDANMDMLCPDGESGIDMYSNEWPIYARTPIQPPHVTGPNAVISHSLVTGGSVVNGTVVKAGAIVEYAIVAEDAYIGPDARVGTPPDGTEEWGIAVVASNVEVAAEGVVPASAMCTEPLKGGEQK